MHWYNYLSITEVMENKKINVGFKVLSMMVMKSSIFWDITPCTLFTFRRLKQCYIPEQRTLQIQGGADKSLVL
jgi:hypothetical protein